MNRLPNVHPGEVLLEEYIKPAGLTVYRVAKDTRMSQTRLSEIIRGRRRITAETSLRLAKYFGTSAQFWLGLQNDYDLEEESESLSKTLEQIPSFQGAPAK
jgi:addiction module HigA family antidote